ncbi:hypothetical protein ACJQWK_09633 [Exserohilum turcicum]
MLHHSIKIGKPAPAPADSQALPTMHARILPNSAYYSHCPQTTCILHLAPRIIIIMFLIY